MSDYLAPMALLGMSTWFALAFLGIAFSVSRMIHQIGSWLRAEENGVPAPLYKLVVGRTLEATSWLVFGYFLIEVIKSAVEKWTKLEPQRLDGPVAHVAIFLVDLFLWGGIVFLVGWLLLAAGVYFFDLVKSVLKGRRA